MTHNVHLCLLSEQPAPNLCPVLDSRFEVQEVVFATSPQQQRRVPWLEKVLKPKGIRVSTLPIDDAFLFEPILATLEQEIARRRQQGQRLTINATGGTKPMSIAAHMAGFNADLPVFYVQNDHIYWLNDPDGQCTDFDLEERLKLDAYLQAHGCPVVESGSPQVRPEHMDLFRRLTDTFAEQVKTLNWLAWKADMQHSLKVDLPAHLDRNEHFQALLDQLDSAGLVRPQVGNLCFIDDNSRALCNGFWLEDFCLKEAQSYRRQDANIQDICRGLNIEVMGEGNKPVKNELDLTILRHNRLHLIECKTRQFKGEGQPDAANALYKLATLSKQVGGNQSKAMLVSFYSFSSHDQERARALGIELVDGPNKVKNFKSRLAQWLSN